MKGVEGVESERKEESIGEWSVKIAIKKTKAWNIGENNFKGRIMW